MARVTMGGVLAAELVVSATVRKGPSLSPPFPSVHESEGLQLFF